ncbi:hypothetical protein NP233_g756 [Leucocoprinus birnbaumii]|uniref:Uncharacterized protein n=1 Tax=Leucocoprinus birnbaumii TaxID=56174 RepID=A0AAD5W528_9AGAR|nr:hypothetical protein NP233_g756 [Leucocoprinus birnbaumii]
MTSPGNVATSGLPHVPYAIASPVEEKINPTSPGPSPEPESAVSRRDRIGFYLRVLLFCIFEGAFIVLAAVCLAKPIPLHIALNLSDSEVKGGFTVVFIVWHSLAILAGGHILADAFSREWSVRLADIQPGRSDRVSTVTSGFLDRILHIISKHSSGTFKLAFLASLSFMALSQLAPGTISAATTLIDIPVVVQVGQQLSQITSNIGVEQFLAVQNRANLIVRLEEIERSPFGFNLPPNILVSLPSSIGQFNGTLEYDTDVVGFHHDCHWEAPAIINATFGNTSNLAVSAAGQVWQTTLIVGGQATGGSSISPLALGSFQSMESVGTSAYLFIGGNSTFVNSRATPAAPFAINLGTLPATFVTQGVGVTAGSDIALEGPLASVLVCDPHIDISGGRVRLLNDGTVEVISSGQSARGSFPISAANLIFSNALQVALIGLEPLEVANLVNNVASDMFMPSNGSIDWNTVENVPPLDLPTINKNVDTFMSSAAKAFIDGYRKTGASTIPTFDQDSVAGIGQEQRLALTTSRGLFITTIVVDVIALLLLYALCRSALTQERYPFNLFSVFQVLSEDERRRDSLLSPTRQWSQRGGPPSRGPST